jgi:hypothetical protein
LFYFFSGAREKGGGTLRMQRDRSLLSLYILSWVYLFLLLLLLCDGDDMEEARAAVLLNQ